MTDCQNKSKDGRCSNGMSDPRFCKMCNPRLTVTKAPTPKPTPVVVESDGVQRVAVKVHTPSCRVVDYSASKAGECRFSGTPIIIGQPIGGATSMWTRDKGNPTAELRPHRQGKAIFGTNEAIAMIDLFASTWNTLNATPGALDVCKASSSITNFRLRAINNLPDWIAVDIRKGGAMYLLALGTTQVVVDLCVGFVTVFGLFDDKTRVIQFAHAPGASIQGDASVSVHMLRTVRATRPIDLISDAGIKPTVNTKLIGAVSDAFNNVEVSAEQAEARLNAIVKKLPRIKKGAR